MLQLLTGFDIADLQGVYILWRLFLSYDLYLEIFQKLLLLLFSVWGGHLYFLYTSKFFVSLKSLFEKWVMSFLRISFSLENWLVPLFNVINYYADKLMLMRLVKIFILLRVILKILLQLGEICIVIYPLFSLESLIVYIS